MGIKLLLRKKDGVSVLDSSGNKICKIAIMGFDESGAMKATFHVAGGYKVRKLSSYMQEPGETVIDFIDPLSSEALERHSFWDLESLDHIPWDDLPGKASGAWAFKIPAGKRDRVYFKPGTWTTTRAGALDRFENNDDICRHLLKNHWEYVAVSPDGDRCGRWRESKDQILWSPEEREAHKRNRK